MIINLPTAARVIPTRQLKGFGGCWLVLFAVGVYLAPLPSIVNIFKIGEGIDESVSTRFPLVFDGAFALVVSLLIIQLTMAVFMAEKSRGFPSLFIWTGIYIFAMTPLDLIWTGAVVSLPTGQSFGEVITKVTSADVIGGWIGATVIVGVWMLYVTRSRRVANTFVQ
jgi:hypothetical protein